MFSSSIKQNVFYFQDQSQVQTGHLSPIDYIRPSQLNQNSTFQNYTLVLYVWWVYLFPMIAIINYPNLGGLKNKNLFFHSSRGQGSEISFTGPNTRCQYGHPPSRCFREESIPCIFQILMIASIL